MNTRILAVLSLVLSFGFAVFGTGFTVVRAAQAPADCAGLPVYSAAYHQVGVDLMATFDDLDTSRMEEWTAPDFQRARTALDQAIADVEALQPPDIAIPFQEQALASMQLYQEMLTAFESGGMLAALPYVDKLKEASNELNAIALPLETHCQTGLLDNDDDGTPEVGPGTQTPVATASASTETTGS